MAPRLTPQDLQLRAWTEAQLQGAVEAIAGASGWRYYHAPDNRPVTAASGKRYVQSIKRGFPDLTLVKGPRLLFVELKRQKPKMTIDQAQIDWLLELQAAGAEVALWRPSDLPLARRVLLEGAPCPTLAFPLPNPVP